MYTQLQDMEKRLAKQYIQLNPAARNAIFALRKGALIHAAKRGLESRSGQRHGDKDTNSVIKEDSNESHDSDRAEDEASESPKRDGQRTGSTSQAPAK
jgi:hypothetical protein